jgi:hypothetical protein
MSVFHGEQGVQQGKTKMHRSLSLYALRAAVPWLAQGSTVYKAVYQSLDLLLIAWAFGKGWPWTP